jgi:hypothetical protein
MKKDSNRLAICRRELLAVAAYFAFGAPLSNATAIFEDLRWALNAGSPPTAGAPLWLPAPRFIATNARRAMAWIAKASPSSFRPSPTLRWSDRTIRRRRSEWFCEAPEALGRRHTPPHPEHLLRVDSGTTRWSRPLSPPSITVDWRGTHASAVMTAGEQTLRVNT